MDSDDPLEFLEERAAIMQFDGGASRQNAEYYAAVLMRRYCAVHGIAEPKSHWSAVMPRGEWDDDEGKPVYRREPMVPPGLGKG